MPFPYGCPNEKKIELETISDILLYETLRAEAK